MRKPGRDCRSLAKAGPSIECFWSESHITSRQRVVVLRVKGQTDSGQGLGLPCRTRTRGPTLDLRIGREGEANARDIYLPAGGRVALHRSLPGPGPERVAPAMLNLRGLACLFSGSRRWPGQRASRPASQSASKRSVGIRRARC